MPRHLQFETGEWGSFRVFGIRVEEDGSWEGSWDLLREHPELESLRDVIPTVGREAWIKALNGWGGPLLRQSGLDPEGARAKIDEALSLCKHREPCESHDPEICRTDAGFPPCFLADVDGAGFEVRAKVTTIYEHWKDGTRVVLVPSD